MVKVIYLVLHREEHYACMHCQLKVGAYIIPQRGGADTGKCIYGKWCQEVFHHVCWSSRALGAQICKRISVSSLHAWTVTLQAASLQDWTVLH